MSIRGLPLPPSQKKKEENVYKILSFFNSVQQEHTLLGMGADTPQTSARVSGVLGCYEFPSHLMALYLSTVPCARAFRLVRASHEFKSLPIVLQAEMTERATCWSLTINNPTEQDLKVSLPAGWSMTGQMERGEEGTEHYQGMLKTTQVRFTAVKNYFHVLI